MNQVELMRKKILDAVMEFARASAEKSPAFYPGQSHVPVSGKMIDGNDLQNLVDACLDGWLTTGRFAHEFESRFAAFMGQGSCSLTNSGSSANLLAVSALTSPLLGERRLQPGDEVITVAAGFPTTVNPIIQNGLVPVFVDINLTDFSLNVDLLAQALSPKVKAIMLAHTLGNPFDVERIAAFAKENDLWMIEDCCDAVGSKFNGKMVGTFGDIATVSFYPAHHITMGEGGAVLTRSAKLKRIIESFRDWGRDCWCETGCDNTCGKRFEWQLGELPEGYDHKFTYSHLGYNLKVTDMQAALGLSQLDKIEQFNRARIENFNFLREQLAGLEKYLKLPTARPGAEPVWFGFPIIVKPNSPLSRTQLIVELDKRKIGTRLLFGGNLLKQPYMKSVKTRVVGPLENTDVAMENVFWIGVQPNLTSEMRKYVVDQFYNIFDYSNHTV